MEKIKPDLDLSDNLYYADQLGSIEDQIKFLDSLHICSACFNVDSLGHEFCELHVVVTSSDRKFFSRIIVLRPSLSSYYFRTRYVLDIKSYLVLQRNFVLNSQYFYYSPLKSD